MLASDTVIDRIRTILKTEFPDDTVDVAPSGIGDNIHVVVMSRKFDNMTSRQKDEYLWAVIDTGNLSDEEKLRISMILPLSPDDVK